MKPNKQPTILTKIVYYLAYAVGRVIGLVISLPKRLGNLANRNK